MAPVVYVYIMYYLQATVMYMYPSYVDWYNLNGYFTSHATDRWLEFSRDVKTVRNARSLHPILLLM